MDRNGQYIFLLFMGIKFFIESLSSSPLFSFVKKVHRGNLNKIRYHVVKEKISLQAFRLCKANQVSFFVALCSKFVPQTGKCCLVGLKFYLSGLTYDLFSACKPRQTFLLHKSKSLFRSVLDICQVWKHKGEPWNGEGRLFEYFFLTFIYFLKRI